MISRTRIIFPFNSPSLIKGAIVTVRKRTVPPLVTVENSSEELVIFFSRHRFKNAEMSSSSIIEDPNSLDLKLLCVYAFDTLISALTNEKIITEIPLSLKSKEFPLFVTWTTGPSKKLRGCIGTFQSDNLEQNLKYFSLTAAFKDSRFSPISSKEIKNLNVGISLLTNFEKAKDPYDWEIGKHGIEIRFLK